MLSGNEYAHFTFIHVPFQFLRKSASENKYCDIDIKVFMITEYMNCMAFFL